jgi:esterase/lipase/carbon monoxide dehydrogenase subunit G
MIEISEKFTVAATPDRVYAVLSDPDAVVECVAGASLGERHEDGSFDGLMTVKFSALKIAFKGRVSLDLDDANRRGTVTATGRDGQGGTKFKASAVFDVSPIDGGAATEVTAQGEVDLNGKLASLIENAASAVVKRMTGAFITALSLRCVSGDAQLGAATTGSGEASDSGNPSASDVRHPERAVLLLHGFGGTPNSMLPWGEALAAAGVAVSIPRLPGHGTRWQDLNATDETEWTNAAGDALQALRKEHERVFVMGLSFGATLAIRLAETRPDDVAGVVAVNAVTEGLPRTSSALRTPNASAAATTNDVKRDGATDPGYERVGLKAAGALRRLGAAALAEAGAISAPVLVVSSAEDHVVPPAQSTQLFDALPADRRERLELTESYHAVPLDNDASTLFDRSIAFITDNAAIEA